MGDEESKRFVDELLDASLRGYCSEEPRVGLEARLLAAVPARERAARRRWVWSLAGVMAAAAVVAVVLYVPRRRPAPVMPTPQAVVPKPQTPMTLAFSQPRPATPQESRGRSRRVTAQLHRPAQFPTPAPLTEQEKLVLRYVQIVSASNPHAPEKSLSQDLEIPKVSIAKLEIEPLPGSQTEQEK